MGLAFLWDEVEIFVDVDGACGLFLSEVNMSYSREVGGRPLASGYGSWIRWMMMSLNVSASSRVESVMACLLVQFRCFTWAMPLIWMSLIGQ